MGRVGYGGIVPLYPLGKFPPLAFKPSASSQDSGSSSGTGAILNDWGEGRGVGFTNRKTQWWAFKRKSSLVEYQPIDSLPANEARTPRNHCHSLAPGL
jgi:hypothetical protein